MTGTATSRERAMMRRMNDINHALDAWLGDLARAGRSPATRRKYFQILCAFAIFLEDHGVRDCDQINRDHCRRFLDRWVDSSASTQALGWSILNGFCGFLEAETVIDRGANPMDGIPRARRKRAEDLDVVTVTARDVERMFTAADGWQEILCLSVLAYLGPRRNAAANLRRRDVDLDRGTMRFREKGGKVIRKPIPDELAAIIRAADSQNVWLSEDAYLIPNRRPHRNPERSAKVIYDTVKKIARRAGVRTHVHALRAAFAVQFDEQNPGRLVALKELLGHARIETTMVYLRRQDKAREMETVRALSWGSVFPHNPGLPPAGFEPAFPETPDEGADGAVTLPSSLPAALRQKLDELRERREAEAGDRR